MRLVPIVLFYNDNLVDVLRYAAKSSCTTHAAPEAVESCQLFAELISRALHGVPKDSLLHGLQFKPAEPSVIAIARGDFLAKSDNDIQGTGYCIASLEAALWCFFSTDSFSAAVLRAANLGDDADTTAAIVGQIAGAFYGAESIPPHWRAMLSMREDMEDMADRLYRRVA